MSQEILGYIITSIGSASGVILWLSPRMKKISSMLRDWNGEEARPGYAGRPGVMERLEKIEGHINKTCYNTAPNGGGSAYDAQTELLKQIYERVSNE